jgi:hypothetical protein
MATIGELFSTSGNNIFAARKKEVKSGFESAARKLQLSRGA